MVEDQRRLGSNYMQYSQAFPEIGGGSGRGKGGGLQQNLSFGHFNQEGGGVASPEGKNHIFPASAADPYSQETADEGNLRTLFARATNDFLDVDLDSFDHYIAAFKETQHNESQVQNGESGKASSNFVSPFYPHLNLQSMSMGSMVSPPIYFIQMPPLEAQKLMEFDVTILFFIFYNQAHEKVQVESYNELQVRTLLIQNRLNRRWKYHRKSNVWFRLIESADEESNLVQFMPSEGKKKTRKANADFKPYWVRFNPVDWKVVPCPSSELQGGGNVYIPPLEELQSSPIDLSSVSRRS